MEDRQSTPSNYVIDPNVEIAGKTQTQLADDFIKLWIGTSIDDNPVSDRTGDFSGVNQSGNVYLLAGGPNSPGPLERNIVVPDGKYLFFPIVNYATVGNNISDTRFVNSSNPGGIGDLAYINNYTIPLSVFNLTIDGQQVLGPSDSIKYVQKTPQTGDGFSFHTPENSVLAGSDYDNTLLTLSYQGGYYVGLKPLPPGKHTIEFEAVAGDGAKQQVSYTIDVKPFNEDIKGNDKNNTLTGNGKNDNIDAFGGNDTVYGYGGDDIIDGGSGNDKLYGGNGKDIVYGGAGNDLLDGGNGDDVLAGGVGNDNIDGGNGHDRLYGGSGKDTIEGGNGNDVIFGGSGNDKIAGGNGNDVIDAVAYAPLILGGFIITESGKGQIDKIEGGNGRDTFVLGMASGSGVTGSAYYVGGGDKDYALIQDFKLGSNGDKIQLYSKDINPSDYVLGAVTNGLPNGVGIYTNDTAHDLIGIVQGHNVSLSTLSLTNNSQFNLVG